MAMRRVLVALVLGVSLFGFAPGASAHWDGIRRPTTTHPVPAGHAFTSNRRLIHQRSPIARPACVLGTGPAGDATVTTAVAGNPDSLDLLAFGFRTDRKNKTVTALLQVVNLSDGPGGTTMLYGTSEDWTVTFGVGSTTYFLQAGLGSIAYQSSGDGAGVIFNTPSVPPNAQAGMIFVYGRIDHGTINYYNRIGLGSGSLDQTTNVVSITAPWSAFADGTWKPGQVLEAPIATTFYEVGTPYIGALEQADSIPAPDQVNYTIGQTC
jgi:hypothetical protein